MATATKNQKKPLCSDPPHDVLTLAEAAAYLRLSEDAIVEAIQRQYLPGRKVRAEWRFLKSALQDWLRASPQPSSREALASLAGAWKNDPHLADLIQNIYRRRSDAVSAREG